MMHRILVLGFALLIAVPAAAQVADTLEARLEAARTLVDATGGQRQVQAIMQAMRGAMIANIQQATRGQITEPQIIAIVDEVLMPEFQTRSGEMVAHSVQVWAERLTVAEMRELVVFYRSPIGQRLNAVLPEVAAEGARFGQQWGQRVAMEAITRNRDALRARGLPF